MSDARPYPKSAQLGAQRKRYRRRIASAKTWARIVDAKQGPCRICTDPATNGRLYGRIEFHHIVSRQDGGDDTEANIVPLCPDCHGRITRRSTAAGALLLAALTDDELAYMYKRGGPYYPEQAYGIVFSR